MKFIDGAEHLSGGEVELLLAERRGVSHVHARTLMRAGVLGEPVRSPGRLWFRSDDVRELAGRPFVNHDAVLVGPIGDRPVFVARANSINNDPPPSHLPRTWAGWDCVRPGEDRWGEQRLAVQGVYDVRTDVVQRWLDDETAGLVPMVVTVAGLVAATFEITKVHRVGRDTSFTLRDTPGEWATDFANHWLRTAGGGPYAWYRAAEPYVRQLRQ